MPKWRIYREEDFMNGFRWVLDAWYAGTSCVSADWWTFNTWDEAVEEMLLNDINMVEF